MSRLGDLETFIIDQLGLATIDSAPAFRTVAGISGGYRPALREAIRRAVAPAALVGFVEEPAGPETGVQVRGARFSVLVVDRVLRQEADPRFGDGDHPGAFALLEAARAQLDDVVPAPGFRLVLMREKFVEADERWAVYELRYRVWPVAATVFAPEVPDGLGASPGAAGAVRLNWMAPGEDETHGPTDFYRVYRKVTGESAFKLSDTAHKETTEILLTGQPTGKPLFYYVTASNAGGEGDPSNTASIEL